MPTSRRRKIQEEYNQKNNITPETVKKNLRAGIEAEAAAHRKANEAVGRSSEEQIITEEFIHELETEMLAAAEALEFEKAAAIRDQVMQLKESLGQPLSEAKVKSPKQKQRRKGGSKVPRPRRAPKK